MPDPQVAVPASPAPPPAPPATASPPPAAVAAPPPAQPAPTSGFWPADWRDRLSKGADGKTDEKRAGRLARYQSPEAIFDAMVAAQTKISSGELKVPKPDNGDTAALSEWRKQNGIPEVPEKYDLNLDGVVIGEEDKPMIQDFLKVAHAADYTPDQVKAAVRQYYANEERIAESQHQFDIEAKTKTEDALRGEWGQEYKTNMARFNSILDSLFTPDMKKALQYGRLADMTPIGSSPEFIKAMVALSLERDPALTIIPAGSGDQVQAIESELAQISKYRKENRAAYYKDEKMQARERQLIAAQQQLATRAGR